MNIDYIISCKSISEAKRLIEKTALLLHERNKPFKVERRKLVIRNDRVAVRFVSVRQGDPAIWVGFRGLVINQDLYEQGLLNIERRANDD